MLKIHSLSYRTVLSLIVLNLAASCTSKNPGTTIEQSDSSTNDSPSNHGSDANSSDDSTSPNDWHSQTGSLAFAEKKDIAINVNQNTTVAISALAIRDLNKDGRGDILALNPNENGLSIGFTKSDNSFQIQHVKAASTFGLSFDGEETFRVADLNNDGHLDVALAFGRAFLATALGNNQGVLQPFNIFPSLPNRFQNNRMTGMELRDITDGKLDWILSSQGNTTYPGGILWVAGKGDGTFESKCSGQQYCTIVPSNVDILDMAMADVNNDGKEDILYTVYGTGTYLLLGKDNGIFDTKKEIHGADGPFIRLGDFNHDSKLDLVMVHDPATQFALSLFLGNGDGTFQAPKLVGSNFFSQSRKLNNILSFADLNGDSHLDIALVSQDNSIRVLLGKGDGSFQTPLKFMVGSKPSSIAIGDVNGDGKPDIIAANEPPLGVDQTKPQTVSLLLNQTQ